MMTTPPAGSDTPPSRPRRSNRPPVPPVTLTIMVICVGIYIAERLWSTIQRALIFAPWLGESEPYRFIGSAFLHADFWHIAFNMYALYLVGQMLEPTLGRWRYLSLYLLSAIGGNVAVLVLADPSGQSYYDFVVGASGAVFGLFAAIFVLYSKFGGDVLPITILLGANLAIGFIVEGISWQSHVGGMVVGGILTWCYTFARGSKHRAGIHVLFTIGVAAALAGLIFLTYAT